MGISHDTQEKLKNSKGRIQTVKPAFSFLKHLRKLSINGILISQTACDLNSFIHF